MTDFDGADYRADRDLGRLTGQLKDIFELMKDGQWRSLEDIEAATKHPQASISAQLRNLRKARFGGFVIDREHVEGGLYRYRLDLEASDQQEFSEEKATSSNREVVQTAADFLTGLVKSKQLKNQSFENRALAITMQLNQIMRGK